MIFEADEMTVYSSVSVMHNIYKETRKDNFNQAQCVYGDEVLSTTKKEFQWIKHCLAELQNI